MSVLNPTCHQAEARVNEEREDRSIQRLSLCGVLWLPGSFVSVCLCTGGTVVSMVIIGSALGKPLGLVESGPLTVSSWGKLIREMQSAKLHSCRMH